MAGLGKILSTYKGKDDELIPILQDVQKKFGYLPKKALMTIAKFTRIPESKVYGVATFYTQFRFSPIGKNHVCVCRGTACHVGGATRILEEVERELGIKEGQTTEDLKYSLETVACIGCCGLSPCITINDKVEAKMTPKKVKGVLSK